MKNIAICLVSKKKYWRNGGSDTLSLAIQELTWLFTHLFTQLEICIVRSDQMVV